MVSFAALYHMIPKLWGTTIHSVKLINLHFWLATVGVVIYIVAMWISGVMQGLMWRAYDNFGNLTYSFAETVAAMHPYYVIRAIGGIVFLLGALVMVYNIYMTITTAKDRPVVAA